jgi:amidase
MFGLKIFMKAVIDAKPWRRDPLAVQKPWDQQEYNLVDHGDGRQLVFAILWNDGKVVPHPPILRALQITRNALIAAGHRGMLITVEVLYSFSLPILDISHRLEAL